MPLNFHLDAFPFRHRSKHLLSSDSSEGDTDESSPERASGQPRIVTAKDGRKSGERRVSITNGGRMSRGTSEKMMEGTLITLASDGARHPNQVDRQTKKPAKSEVVSASPDVFNSGALTKPCEPPAKPTLIRRVASKLIISIPSKSHGLQSRPSTRTLPANSRPSSQLSHPTKVTLPVSPTLPNSFVGKQHREAALRERGLRPPRKDLSEQERETDARIACVPLPPVNGSSEAERLKAKWLANHSTSESSDSDCGPHIIPGSPISSAPSDMDDSRRSCDGKADLPTAGRPSICSSVNALSASSYLEVLHEDPSEHGPITPPPPLLTADLPIIVSSPLEDEFPAPLEIVESPISCSFSSHLAIPGPTINSDSHLDIPPPLPEKDVARHPALPASRRRTADSGDRRRKTVGPALSRFGTSSLSNLRRSVAGSLGLPSSSALSATDMPSSPTLSPRTAISPTIHSRGSILLETKDIQDAESRRLSELAFLD